MACISRCTRTAPCLWCNLQVCILNWVIGPRHILVVITIFIILSLPGRLRLRRVLLLLLLGCGRCGSLPGVGSSSLHIVHVDLVVLFFALDFLAVVYIYGEIIWLIFQLFTFHFLLLGRCSRLLRTALFLSTFLFSVIFDVVHVFTVIETVVIV